MRMLSHRIKCQHLNDFECPNCTRTITVKILLGDPLKDWMNEEIHTEVWTTILLVKTTEQKMFDIWVCKDGRNFNMLVDIDSSSTKVDPEDQKYPWIQTTMYTVPAEDSLRYETPVSRSEVSMGTNNYKDNFELCVPEIPGKGYDQMESSTFQQEYELQEDDGIYMTSASPYAMYR
ncbi:hypothetical protein J6590_024922 [Homalodisca vitripennis]|nr:hypothetical protein J6590_024922 [Homalodisca vitripennis]